MTGAEHPGFGIAHLAFHKKTQLRYDVLTLRRITSANSEPNIGHRRRASSGDQAHLPPTKTTTAASAERPP